MLRRDNGARSGAVRLREAPSPKQYKAVNPMFSVISASTGLGAWFSGAATGIGLFAVVGAQSAFILRQGILRKHIVPVVATCAAIDAIFIFASVAGLRTLTSALPFGAEASSWATGSESGPAMSASNSMASC